MFHPSRTSSDVQTLASKHLFVDHVPYFQRQLREERRLRLLRDHPLLVPHAMQMRVRKPPPPIFWQGCGGSLHGSLVAAFGVPVRMAMACSRFLKSQVYTIWQADDGLPPTRGLFSCLYAKLLHPSHVQS